MGIFKKLRSFVAPKSNNSQQSPLSNSKHDPKFTDNESLVIPRQDPYQKIALEPFTDPKDDHIPDTPVAEEDWELYDAQQYEQSNQQEQDALAEDSLNDDSDYDRLVLVPDYLDHFDETDHSLQEDFNRNHSPKNLGLPETEKVLAISPPDLFNEIASFDDVNNTPEPLHNSDVNNVFISSNLRVDAQAAPRLSLALLPVAVPSPISYALVYREQIYKLRNHAETEAEQESLLELFTLYTQLVPNDIEMWNDYSNLLIELRGLEFAYQQIQKALGKTRDDTAHLLMLADMSRRMCDHHAAWHYISILNELHPNNIEVLTRLRDIQKDCKFFELAQHTDEHIRQLNQQSHISDEYNFPLENMD